MRALRRALQTVYIAGSFLIAGVSFADDCLRARVRIADGEIIDGRLPPSVARVLKEWTALRRDGLIRNWQAARSEKPLEYLGGLDDDDVIGIRSLGEHKLEIEFSDGTIGVRDFVDIFRKTGPMSEPLKDPGYFQRGFIEDGALTWPNGYDWDSIALHDEMKKAGQLRRTQAAE